MHQTAGTSCLDAGFAKMILPGGCQRGDVKAQRIKDIPCANDTGRNAAQGWESGTPAGGRVLCAEGFNTLSLVLCSATLDLPFSMPAANRPG
jgi:hypothetical protein